MKVNLELYCELLQAEVLRLRQQTIKRQGAIGLFGLESSDAEAARLATETFEPIKNLDSGAGSHGQ